jgi:cytochrome c oxidase subunit 2
MTVPHIDIGSFWLPKQTSTLAPQTDAAFQVVYWVSVVFFTLIVGSMLIFAVRYRRRSETDKTSPIDHSTRLEAFWTIIPTLLVIGLFFIGFNGYVNAAVAPGDAYEIHVVAEKWLWTFYYPNGLISPSKLVVPRDRPVKLIMSSKDVIHSFFVPEFRVKQDVVPGEYTTVWFQATEAKETALLCTEYCGAGHSDMLATVSVVDGKGFQDFLDSGGLDKNMSLADQGKALFKTWGCSTCHSLDGSRIQGPSFKHLYGREEAITGGPSVKVDDNYLRESILQSNAKIVLGYPAIMPVFQGVLRDPQVNALIEFIKAQQ